MDLRKCPASPVEEKGVDRVKLPGASRKPPVETRGNFSSCHPRREEQVHQRKESSQSRRVTRGGRAQGESLTANGPPAWPRPAQSLC